MCVSIIYLSKKLISLCDQKNLPKITSVVCAMEVIVLKTNYMRSGLWKALNDEPESGSFNTGNGMPLKVFEYKVTEITFIRHI